MSNKDVIIIENIFGTISKTDIIREILRNTTCPKNKNVIQSDHRNIADCGSLTKEVEN